LLWKLKTKVITLILLVPAYSKFNSLLSHLSSVNTPLENMFPHLSVFKQEVHQVTFLSNQSH
uniref:Uncharacterized protein n=1 Tax=Equus asinus asinus TaxID=83772 RepID=A0A8C4M962_EQUAS